MEYAASGYAYNNRFGVVIGQKEISGCNVVVCVSNEAKKKHENNVVPHLVQSYEMRMKTQNMAD